MGSASPPSRQGRRASGRGRCGRSRRWGEGVSFRQTTVSGFPAIALRTDELEVVVVPSLGMKLTNLRRPRGREWLWRNDQIPLAPPRGRVRRSWRPPTAADGTSASLPSRPRRCLGAARYAAAPGPRRALERARGPAPSTSTRAAPPSPAPRPAEALPYEFHRELTLDPHRAGRAAALPAAEHRRRCRSPGSGAHIPCSTFSPGARWSCRRCGRSGWTRCTVSPSSARGDIVSWPARSAAT